MRSIAALLLAVSVAVPVRAQDASAGDTLTVSVDSTIELDIVVRDGKGEDQRNLRLVRSEKFSQEVVETADGAPRVVRIRCTESTLEKSGTGLPLDKQSTILEGKTFTAMRAGNGWTVKTKEGAAAPEGGQALGAWNDIGKLLPSDGLSAGKQWTVDGPAVSSLISPAAVEKSVGQLSCTCESLDGGQASILIKGELAGTGKDGSKINILIGAGRLIYNTTTKRPLSLNLSGQIASSLDIIDEYRVPNSNEVEERKVGEINAKSRKMEAVFTFK